MVEYITGLRIIEVFGDIKTFYRKRKKPLVEIETYQLKQNNDFEYEEIIVDTEDYAGLLIHFDNEAHGSLVVNQMAAGRKCSLNLEINGSKESVYWNSEKPNEMWIGSRNNYNKTILKDPSLLEQEAREFSAYPGGHQEGYPDTMKNFFMDFYNFIESGKSTIGKKPTFSAFEDGLRELRICDAVIESSLSRSWITI